MMKFRVTDSSWLGFGGDPDQDANTGNPKGILPLQDRDNCTNFADNPRSCRRILVNFFGRGMSRWQKTLDFDAYPDHDPDPGILGGIFTRAG